MRLNTFFRAKGVFTLEEVRRAREQGGSQNPQTVDRLLRHHKRAGNILQVRRGVYVTVPEGIDPGGYQPDAFQVAAKLVDDAVIGYHSALELHGKAYSQFHEIYILTTIRPSTLEWRGVRYKYVSTPKSLADAEQDFEVTTVFRSGTSVRVTSIERTLVDVLDRPEYGGGWEEIWRSLESIGYINPDRVVAYVEQLGVAKTAAKVGYFLESQRERWMVPVETLEHLKQMIPKQTAYMDRSKGGKLIKDWRLIVPEEILDHTWEEML